MKPTLLILAAGIGSRYGGLKQLDRFGPHGETLVDYSIRDALKSGIGKIVFVIQPTMLNEFRKRFDSMYRKDLQVQYAFQEITQTYGYSAKVGQREKPWGTGHAVLAAQCFIKEPFIVINADDYYGIEAMKAGYTFLTEDPKPKSEEFCLVPYKLADTLSDSGSVARAECVIDQQGYLNSIKEWLKIERKSGTIVTTDSNNQQHILAGSTPVSMNFWGFTPHIFPLLKTEFYGFLASSAEDPKAEYLLPNIIEKMINTKMVSVKVLESGKNWFGVTYKADKERVQEKIKKMNR